MSAETIQYLNHNTLIGFAESDGHAWHWDGVTDNHYDGAIPTDDVYKRLFSWDADFSPLHVEDIHGNTVLDPDRLAVVRYDALGAPVKVFNIVSERYAIHQYAEWLVENVATLIDVSAGDLQVGSAGLLSDGAVAWVQVRPTDTVSIGGSEQLPHIVAATSHDSSIATTYKGCQQIIVCDNTLQVGLGERTSTYRVKHTSGSKASMAQARQALDIIFTGMEEFNAEMERLMNTSFTTDQFRQSIEVMYGERPGEKHDEEGKVTNTRALNNWDRRTDELTDMWLSDPRVGEFTGTQWGGLMAHNTWSQWGMAERDTNDRDRADAKLAQITSTINGDGSALDRKWMGAMNGVLADA